jgi:hypothetical protein
MSGFTGKMSGFTGLVSGSAQNSSEKKSKKVM